MMWLCDRSNRINSEISRAILSLKFSQMQNWSDSASQCKWIKIWNILQKAAQEFPKAKKWKILQNQSQSLDFISLKRASSYWRQNLKAHKQAVTEGG